MNEFKEYSSLYEDSRAISSSEDSMSDFESSNDDNNASLSSDAEDMESLDLKERLKQKRITISKQKVSFDAPPVGYENFSGTKSPSKDISDAFLFHTPPGFNISIFNDVVLNLPKNLNVVSARVEIGVCSYNNKNYRIILDPRISSEKIRILLPSSSGSTSDESSNDNKWECTLPKIHSIVVEEIISTVSPRLDLVKSKEDAEKDTSLLRKERTLSDLKSKFYPPGCKKRHGDTFFDPKENDKQSRGDSSSSTTRTKRSLSSRHDTDNSSAISRKAVKVEDALDLDLDLDQDKSPPEDSLKHDDPQVKKERKKRKEEKRARRLEKQKKKEEKRKRREASKSKQQ